MEPVFQCHCGLRYRRKEHLIRHAKCHSEANSPQCPFCDKTFGRNDTLRQHVRTHHQNKDIPRGRAAQACSYCRSRRSRCDGNLDAPCAACVLRGLQCSFTQSAERCEGQSSQSSVVHPASASLGLRRHSESIEKSPNRILPYIQAYFEKFHPYWPFLHRATFDPNNEPAFLLQSVAMIGLWVSEGGQPSAMDLHAQLTTSIYQQKDRWDVSSRRGEQQQGCHSNTPGSIDPWPMATYQGILLHLIFALLQGGQDRLDLRMKQSLSEIPSQLLVALVRSCLQRNMFSYPTMFAHFNSASVPDVFIWVGIEEVKRFALALYKVCRRCRVDDAKLLSLADLQFAMPDSDELWHASSGLASRIPASYSDRNKEDNWISQAARFLQSDGADFDWI
ncbi:C2H2 type zinc finger domain protein [Aspergillus pseudonomiae]|nr:C2H2 type zinc finger domain protein [Aspergillus pseudonomiae]